MNKRGGEDQKAACWEAPNCLVQHVMTSLLHINLSLLRAISVSSAGGKQIQPEDGAELGKRHWRVG